jgi:hypothetical protein
LSGFPCVDDKKEVSVADGSMKAGIVAEYHWVEIGFSIKAGVIHK